MLRGSADVSRNLLQSILGVFCHHVRVKTARRTTSSYICGITGTSWILENVFSSPGGLPSGFKCPVAAGGTEQWHKLRGSAGGAHLRIWEAKWWKLWISAIQKCRPKSMKTLSKSDWICQIKGSSCYRVVKKTCQSTSAWDSLDIQAMKMQMGTFSFSLNVSN